MLAVDIAKTIDDAGATFSAAWPRFSADADDFTIKNDGTIPPRSGAMPAHRGMSSLSAASGAVQGAPTGRTRRGLRLAALAGAVLAVA